MQFLLANPLSAEDAAQLIDQVGTVVATFGQETAHRKGDVASRLYFDLGTRMTFLAGHDVLVIGAEAVTLFYAAGGDPQQVRICAEGSWREDLQYLYDEALAAHTDNAVAPPAEAAFEALPLEAEPAEAAATAEPALVEEPAFVAESEPLPGQEPLAGETRDFAELDELFADPADTAALEVTAATEVAAAWELPDEEALPLADDLTASADPAPEEAWEPALAGGDDAAGLSLADEPLTELDTLAVSEAEPQAVAELEVGPQAVAEWEAEPQAVAELDVEPPAVAEGEAEPQAVVDWGAQPQAPESVDGEVAADVEDWPQAETAADHDQAATGVAEAVGDWPTETTADDLPVMDEVAGDVAETKPAWQAEESAPSQPAAPAGGPSWLNEGAVEERPKPKAPSGPAPAWMDGNPFEDRPKPKAPSGPPPAWMDGNPFEDRPKPKAPSGPPPSWLREGPVEEAPPPPKPTAAAPSWLQEGADAAPAPQPAATGNAWSTPEEPEPWAEAGGLGLDAAHQGLLQALSSLPSWQRQEFEQLAATYGLDPDQAIEMLNAVAVGIVGRPVCEGDDPIWVAEDLAQALLG